MDKKTKSIINIVPVNETLAMGEKAKKDPETNMGIPSKPAVIDAKEWVDENQK